MFLIDVYKKNTKKDDFFSRNGDATLEKCISCTSKERLNGEYELEVVYPLNDRKASFLKKWNVIKADGQLFRIYNIKNDFINNKVTVSARHIFYDLDNYFTEDLRAVECNVKDAMNKALETNGLNKLYTVDSDIIEKNTLYFVEESPSTSLFSIISRWGVGELIRDNFNITIRNDVTYTEEYEIRYKKNILGLVAEENIDNIVTKIYPVGYNGITLPEKYLFVPKTNFTDETLPPYDVVKKVKFDDATDQSTLRIEATRYVEKISTPFTNIKCDMVEIYNTPKYQSRFKNIKKIKPGDVCKVIHDEYNFYVFMKCVYIERDLINAENNKVELGELKSVLDKSPDFSDVYSKIEQSKPSMYFYQNENMVKTNEEYKELFYEGIGVNSSTHLKLYITLNGVSENDNNILDIGIFVNNKAISFTPKHILRKGENIVAVPIAIPALQAGEAYWLSVKIKTSNGSFTIEKNNAQVFAEGTGLDGGTSAERPHIEFIHEVKRDDFMIREINDTGILFTHQTPIPQKVTEEIDINISGTTSKVVNDFVTIEVVKVLDEALFKEDFFELNNEFVIVGNYTKLRTEYNSNVSKEQLEDGYIHKCTMPLNKKFASIESEIMYE